MIMSNVFGTLDSCVNTETSGRIDPVSTIKILGHGQRRHCIA
jgi:hypothetical protein